MLRKAKRPIFALGVAHSYGDVCLHRNGALVHNAAAGRDRDRRAAIANTCFYYPEDRGISESVRFGKLMVARIAVGLRGSAVEAPFRRTVNEVARAAMGKPTKTTVAMRRIPGRRKGYEPSTRRAGC